MNKIAHKILFPKFNLYQPKKQHPDWKKLNTEAAYLALTIAKNIKIRPNLSQNVQIQKRKFLSILKTVKNLIINKLKMAEHNHNFIPLFYIWTMTNNCNFECSYCSDHRGGVYPILYNKGFNKDLTTEQGKQLLNIMKESSAIYWCGGEPTLRKDLPELLEYSAKLNMFNMINTNGSLIGDLLLRPDYRNFLFYMDVIIISLDSLNISQLSKMYKIRDDLSRKVLRNLLALKILQNYVPFKLVANTVITKETIDDSFDILDFCNDLGITFSPVSANIESEPDWELLHNPRYQNLVGTILERADQGYPMIASKKVLNRLLNFNGFNCFPIVFDHIDYSGELFWPCKAYKNATRISVLNYKNVKMLHKAAQDIINPTFFHGNGKNQCGGNCAWMQNCVSEIYAEALKLGILESGILKEIKRLLN
ncbi:MAG: radical SAM protein [Promethearchaeota archaeon]